MLGQGRYWSEVGGSVDGGPCWRLRRDVTKTHKLFHRVLLSLSYCIDLTSSGTRLRATDYRHDAAERSQASTQRLCLNADEEMRSLEPLVSSCWNVQPSCGLVYFEHYVGPAKLPGATQAQLRIQHGRDETGGADGRVDDGYFGL